VAKERTIAALGEMVGNYPAAVDERVVVVASRGRVAKMGFTGQGAKCYMSCIPGFLFRNPPFFLFPERFCFFPDVPSSFLGKAAFVRLSNPVRWLAWFRYR